MDPKPQTLPAPSQEISPVQIQKPGPKSKNLLILGGIGIFIVVLSLIFLVLKHTTQKATRVSGGTETAYPTKSILKNSGEKIAESKRPMPFLYGSWFTNESRIYVADPETHQSRILASLPFAIKSVHPLSSSKILYINHTNEQDQGTDISLWDTTTQMASKIVQADEGLLVDTYAVSPNGRYLVDWELQLNPQTNTVKGGKSRVYTIDISNPTKKTLLYDETAAGNTIHYPILITNTKEVYLDNYLPNTGVGYGYGMTVSNFEGTNKYDLPDMRDGTYTTQPELTNDGKYLIFTGYDGSKGKGTDIDQGTRISMKNPTSVDVYDIAAKQRSTLVNLPKKPFFYNVLRSKSDPDVIFFQAADALNSFENAVYTYSLSARTLKRVVLPTFGTQQPIVASALSSNTLLIGTLTSDKSIAGSLPMRYSKPFTALAEWNTETNEVIPLPLGDVTLAQYIDTLATNSKVLGVSFTPKSGNQIYTVPFATLTPTPLPTATPVPLPTATPPKPAAPTVTKPNLDAIRVAQQSGPTTRDRDTFRENGTQLFDAVNDPLYIYGLAGKKIAVKIDTTISHAYPASSGQYSLMLAGNGKLLMDTKLYDSLSYDFVPRIRPQVSTYGVIAASNTLPETILWYAEKLGLNQKETEELLAYARAKLAAPFTLVSFFDEKTSEQMNPISFSPKPDTYENIIFYFKDLDFMPLTQPIYPLFPKVTERFGLTAIAIGEIHER